mmetsp:Transcript_19739/g.35579  ORF Transcript_19739/g.35579 Transcript_19739/m.35579 type:complete len:262 (-) Transcript_19739:1141-1926(-)
MRADIVLLGSSIGCGSLARHFKLSFALSFVLLILFAAVHFMHTLDGKLHAEILGLFDDRILKKVVGVQGLFGRPTSLGILFHELANEFHGFVRHPFWMWQILTQAFAESIWKDLVGRTRGILFPESTLLFQVGPILLIGSTTYLEDEFQLMGLVSSLEKSRSTEHFGNDTSDTPHVNLGCVFNTSQEEFGWSVPQGDNLVGKTFHFRVPASGESPISNFEFTLSVDQKIGCLEITMNDLVSVHVMDSAEQLLRPRLDVILG